MKVRQAAGTVKQFFLNTLNWTCLTSTDPKLSQSMFRAGIRLDASQFLPLGKAPLLPRVNWFIVDDVDLGKTTEAGLLTLGRLDMEYIDRVQPGKGEKLQKEGFIAGIVSTDNFDLLSRLVDTKGNQDHGERCEAGCQGAYLVV